MTRHSKNATAGPTYTYHEKCKDSQQSGYGVIKMRVGKEAIKDFDCCSLSLQPCRNPCITPDGWIYEKEAILEYILNKKLEKAKLMKAYEKQKGQKDRDLQELAEIQQKERLEKFLASEGKLVATQDKNKTLQTASSTGTTPSSSSSSSSSSTKSSSSASDSNSVPSVSNMSGDLSKKLSSFWVPSLCPDSKTQAPIKKPDMKIYCPMSNKPITIKDLHDIKFKEFKDAEDPKKALITRDIRYVCALTNDALSNSVPCVALVTSGSVITQEACDKIVRKDMIDPINEKKLTEKDIIPIQRGGTGYAGNGAQLNCKKVTPSMVS